jgi:uncharacterized protein YndB with AHSA1/START domain
MTDEAIIIDVAVAAPPRLVWRVLSEPALLARWLGDNDIEAAAGARFQVRPGGLAGPDPVACEVIEAEPEKLLSYRWRSEGRTDALDTVVTWVLDPTPDGGTRLRLVHDGFPITLARTPASGASMCAANDNHRSLAWAA